MSIHAEKLSLKRITAEGDAKAKEDAVKVLEDVVSCEK
jgi:hypothetical protein